MTSLVRFHQNPLHTSNPSESLGKFGFAFLHGSLSECECDELLEEIERSALTRSKAGIRHAMRDPAIKALAHSPRLLQTAQEVLGANALPFRATLFDKSPRANWLVVWHQDTALPLRDWRHLPGWGPWSKKEGITYAHAPASALSQVLALRVHLDESNLDNGPLRVLPGTHKQGVLSDGEIEELVATTNAVTCVAGRGGIVAMKPLIVHASSKSKSDAPRRVLHIEYAGTTHFGSGLELASV